MSLVRIVSITVMKPGVAVSDETVPLQLVAECLRQFDIALDSIDLISHGARTGGLGHLAAIDDGAVGPLPATAQRSVWLVIRLNPTLCPRALRRYRGDWDGMVRRAVTATRLVVNRLREAGLSGHILTAGELAEATDELLDGVALDSMGETWLTCHVDRFGFLSFWIRPTALTTSNLDLCRAPVRAADIAWRAWWHVTPSATGGTPLGGIGRARLRVGSSHPAAWREMVDQVGDHDMLCVVDVGRNSVTEGAEFGYSVGIFDNVAEQTVGRSVTTVVTNPALTGPSPGADVVLQLATDFEDAIRASARADSPLMTMVPTDDEMRYIKTSLETAA